jgi:hypothetical protein
MTDILFEAVKNSYMILAGEMNLKEVLIYSGKEMVPFVHDPDTDFDEVQVGKIIGALEELEYYECCSRIIKIRNEIQRLSGSDNKSRISNIAPDWAPIFRDASKNWEDLDISWDLYRHESIEGSVFNKEEGNKWSLKGLQRFISKLFSSGNKL